VPGIDLITLVDIIARKIREDIITGTSLDNTNCLLMQAIVELNACVEVIVLPTTGGLIHAVCIVILRMILMSRDRLVVSAHLEGTQLSAQT